MLRQLKSIFPNRFKRVAVRTIRNFRDSFTYRRTADHRQTIWPVNHIIFVCKGNICRSPFAEHYLRKKVKIKVDIESCGLEVIQSKRPPIEALNAADRFGVNLRNHRSRGLCGCDIDGADLILPMEFSHYKHLVRRFPGKRENIMLLRDFIPGFTGVLCNIDDPYGLAPLNFHTCFRLIMRASDHISEYLVQKNE